MHLIMRSIFNLAGQSAFNFCKTFPNKQLDSLSSVNCLFCFRGLSQSTTARLFSLKINPMERDSLTEIESRSPENFKKTYEDAIKKLNVLQANTWIDPQTKLNFVRSSLTNINLMLKDLDKLSVIHVAGTKGKGSTCAYIESILRHKGYKTGFFSSPHLIEVRERIRINGVSLSKEDFTNYFWICYDQLLEKNQQMPSYFQFLTLMGFYVFHKKKVDVAVIEVGLGGLYDCTNIIENPVVCGITHLGIDHVKVLGDTLESIAAHKAGIFKPGCIAVTVPQKEEALKVLKQTAIEKNCNLYLSPPFSSYDAFKENPVLCNKEPFQHENMSLAIQLTRIWMEHYHKDTISHSELADIVDSNKSIPTLHPVVKDGQGVIEALTLNQWLGRVQIVKRHNLTYYIDGAHNEDSVKLCSKWFKKKSTDEIKSLSDGSKLVKILMFNITGARNSFSLLNLLKDCDFDLAVFTPNICYREEVISDQLKLAVTSADASKVCQTNEKLWYELQSNKDYDDKNTQPASNTSPVCKTHVFESIYDCIVWCSQGKDKALSKHLSKISLTPSILTEADHIQVLVTGSLYLVGGVLTVFKDIGTTTPV
ncbi:folylpolyglutamate synthase, mitochondrial-like [Argonauta hians]